MYGVNEYPQQPKKSILILLKEKLADKLNKMLLATCLITVLAQIADKEYHIGYLDCAVILFNVIILSSFSAACEY